MQDTTSAEKVLMIKVFPTFKPVAIWSSSFQNKALISNLETY